MNRSRKRAPNFDAFRPGSGGTDPEDLKRRLLPGRDAEIRMLFFLGKDVLRRVERCQDLAEPTAEVSRIGDLLLQSSPAW